MSDIYLSEIDESNIGDHHYLEDGDKCYYLYEYTAGKKYDYSSTNSLISNLKKSPSRRNNLSEYRHKERAIMKCAKALADVINPHWLSNATLVPVPPSKSKDHPEYDDRMLRICEKIPAKFKVDVREMVLQKKTIRSAHASDDRPTVNEIYNNYYIVKDCISPKPRAIGIVDDVLTTGAHFKAMQMVLRDHFPDVPIYGIFIARRIRNYDFDNLLDF